MGTTTDSVTGVEHPGWDVTVHVLWHGGASYSAGYVDDDTETMRAGDVVGMMQDRFDNRDGSTPAVDESSESWVWHSDPRGESDPYPDYRVVWSGYAQRFVWDYA